MSAPRSDFDGMGRALLFGLVGLAALGIADAWLVAATDKAALAEAGAKCAAACGAHGVASFEGPGPFTAPKCVCQAGGERR